MCAKYAPVYMCSLFSNGGADANVEHDNELMRSVSSVVFHVS